MDPVILLGKFKSGELNPSFGHDNNFIDSYTSPNGLIASFKQGVSIDPYQLISRVLRLLGISLETSVLASRALLKFALGGRVPDLNPLIGQPIGLITIACGHHHVYRDIFPPIPVISLDQGETWIGLDKTGVKVYPLKTWIVRRFHELFSMLPLYPEDKYFEHDFRGWALYEPKATGFKIRSRTVYKIGRGNFDNLVRLIKERADAIKRANCANPGTFIITGKRSAPTDEPPKKRARID